MTKINFLTIEEFKVFQMCIIKKIIKIMFINLCTGPIKKKCTQIILEHLRLMSRNKFKFSELTSLICVLISEMKEKTLISTH